MVGKKWLIAATVVLLVIGGGRYVRHRIDENMLSIFLEQIPPEKQHCRTLPTLLAQARCAAPPIVEPKERFFEEAYPAELGRCLAARGYGEWRPQGNLTLEQWCEEVSRFRANKIVGTGKSAK